MRVLAFTTAGAGHFLPMLPLLRAVQESGHDLAVCAPDSFGTRVIKAGLNELFVRPDIPAHSMASVFGRMDGLSNQEQNQLYVREVFGNLNLEFGLEAARAAISAFRPNLVIAEEAEVTSRVATAEADIPLALMGIGIGRFADLASELLNEAIRGRGLDPGSGLRPRITSVPESLDDPGPSRRFRMSTTPTAEPDEDPPLVYMTLGSEAGRMPFFMDLATSLVAQFRERPVQVLFTVGQDGPLDALRAQAPANVRIEAWVPQEDIMVQSRAVVGHGGFGTMMSTLAHGLPSIHLPLFALDQHWNAARVQQAGAGLVLDAHEEADQLGSRLEDILVDDRYRIAARRLAAEIADLPPVAEAVPLLESVAS